MFETTANVYTCIDIV